MEIRPSSTLRTRLSNKYIRPGNVSFQLSSLMANYSKKRLITSHLGRRLSNPTSIWQVGGVPFPLCILFSYRISPSHTTPLIGEGCVKGTSQLCHQVSHWWKVFFMSLSRPENPETRDSGKSLIHQLTEVIHAWTYWYANEMVQLQVFIQSALARLLIHSLLLTQWVSC